MELKAEPEMKTDLHEERKLRSVTDMSEKKHPKPAPVDACVNLKLSAPESLPGPSLDAS